MGAAGGGRVAVARLGWLRGRAEGGRHRARPAGRAGGGEAGGEDDPGVGQEEGGLGGGPPGGWASWRGRWREIRSGRRWSGGSAGSGA